MAFEDLDAGDETRRFGDYVGFPHSNADGTDLASASPQPGYPVALDGSGELTAVTGDGTSTVVGILSNYDVYGDTGQEKISDNDANVKFRGEVKANLSDYETDPGDVTTGAYVDNNLDLFVVEHIEDSDYRVQVR